IYIHNDDESVFVNAKMVKSGNAWIYKSYRTNTYLTNLENYARINKKGLWNEENIQEPWEYRRNK
ncbi:MAG: thermonuclease family protein, partial [Gammaproteobacteria bacterium]